MRLTWLVRHRLTVLRVGAGLSVSVILFTTHSWPEGGVVDSVMEVCGPLLIAVGAVGRIWAILYIAGRKSDELVMKGPYSLVRHPLYLFSLILFVGAAAAFENLFLFVVGLPLFVLYYLGTAVEEEKRLSRLFGDRYEAYRRSTPGLFPALRSYSRDEGPGGRMQIDERVVLRTVRESLFFLMLIPAARAVEILHLKGILPALFAV